MESRIRTKLERGLAPDFLDVRNESANHAVKPGSETHFKVILVSSQFSGKKLMERHRLVYSLLQTELQEGVHALSLETRSPEEWQSSHEASPSPLCPKK